jgi:hypothetical protein
MVLLRLPLLFFIFIIHCSYPLSAQNDSASMEQYIRIVPPGISQLVQPLTHYLCDRYSSEEDKVRSISVWIIHNIKYDAKVYSTGKRKKLSPNQILRKRKAICQGYCDLFEAMCREAGITAATIEGYDKGALYEPGDIFVRDDHAWSAVNTGGGWHLLDLTWSAGYLVPKRQNFRRMLYFYFDIPFRQKYKFIKHISYDYYYTKPELFAKDHLPAQPWWQMTSPPISIDVYEKDTLKTDPSAVFQTEQSYSVSVPDFENSNEPVSYLKMAKAAFKFNPKNYRVLTQGKALYAYHWFTDTKKSKSLENKTKAEVYDSCKTIVDEAKDADKEYIRYTSKERIVRLEKNKSYHKASADFNREQKGYIRKETQLNFRYADRIDKQIDLLKQERMELQKENIYNYLMRWPDKKESNKDPDLDGFTNAMNQSNSMNLSRLEDLKSRFLHEAAFTDTMKMNRKYSDSIINRSEMLMYYKMFYRYYFNWNYKMAVDTLQYQHWGLSQEKDSLVFAYDSCLQKHSAFIHSLSRQSDEIRERYKKQLEAASRFYSISSDSLDDLAKDTLRSIKHTWKDYNNSRQVQIDEQIQDLKSEKKATRALNRKLRGERRYNNHEIAYERFRYKFYNRHYRNFYSREKKQAIAYLKTLIELKTVIREEEKKCKEKIKEEEKKEKEEMAKNNSGSE